jgi:hypothetical protein
MTCVLGCAQSQSQFACSLAIPGKHIVNGQRFFEKKIKQKTLEALHELGLYDSEAPIILHGIVSRGDFSQVQIVVTNTGTEDFPLVDIGKLTFIVEQFHSMPKRGGPYNMTMLQNYYLYAILLNIYCYYGAGVQVCDRRPSVRRDLRPTMKIR